MAKKFDLDGARREGYTDTQIADYLAGSQGFDIAGARKEGYTDQEIIGHLNKPEGAELPQVGQTPAMAPSSIGPISTPPPPGWTTMQETPWSTPYDMKVPGAERTGLPGVQGAAIPPTLGGPPLRPRPLPPSQQTFGAPLRYEEPPIRGTHRAEKYYQQPEVRPDWGPQPADRGLLESGGGAWAEGWRGLQGTIGSGAEAVGVVGREAFPQSPTMRSVFDTVYDVGRYIQPDNQEFTERRTAQQVWEDPSLYGAAQWGIESLAQGAPSIITSATASAIHPLLGKVVTYLMSAGEIKQNLEQQGHGEVDASKAALMFGFPSSWLENFEPMRIVSALKKVPVKQTLKEILEQTAKKMSLMKRTGAAGLEGLYEGATEGGQTAISEFANYFLGGEVPNATELFWKIFNDTAAGMVPGWVGGGIQQRAEAKHSAEAREFMEELERNDPLGQYMGARNARMGGAGPGNVTSPEGPNPPISPVPGTSFQQDPTSLVPTPAPAQRPIADPVQVYEEAKAFASNFPELGVSSLVKKFNVTRDGARQILDRLVEEGVFAPKPTRDGGTVFTNLALQAERGGKAAVVKPKTDEDLEQELVAQRQVVPQQTLDSLKSALETLQSLTGQEPGYADIVAQAQAVIDRFRRVSAKKGVDAEAIISGLTGGAPQVTPPTGVAPTPPTPPEPRVTAEEHATQWEQSQIERGLEKESQRVFGKPFGDLTPLNQWIIRGNVPGAEQEAKPAPKVPAPAPPVVQQAAPGEEMEQPPPALERDLPPETGPEKQETIPVPTEAQAKREAFIRARYENKPEKWYATLLGEGPRPEWNALVEYFATEASKSQGLSLQDFAKQEIQVYRRGREVIEKHKPKKEEGQQGLEQPPSALEQAKPAPAAPWDLTLGRAARPDELRVEEKKDGKTVTLNYYQPDGTYVGFGKYTGRFSLIVQVEPKFRRLGYGTRIHSDMQARGITDSTAGTPEGKALLKSRGWVEGIPDQFSPPGFTEKEEEPAPPTSLEEPKPAPPAPQATSFTARMDAAQTADEGRRILGDATDAVEALMRDIGIQPIVGNVAPNYTVGIHILNDKKRVRPALKEAKAKNPAKAKQLEALIQDVLQAYGPGWERVKDADYAREDAKFEKFKKDKPVEKTPPASVKRKKGEPAREAVAPFTGQDISKEPAWYQKDFAEPRPPWAQIVALTQESTMKGRTLPQIVDLAVELHQQRLVAEREKFQVEQQRGKPVTYEDKRAEKEAEKKAAAAAKRAEKKKKAAKQEEGEDLAPITSLEEDEEKFVVKSVEDLEAERERKDNSPEGIVARLPGFTKEQEAALIEELRAGATVRDAVARVAWEVDSYQDAVDRDKREGTLDANFIRQTADMARVERATIPPYETRRAKEGREKAEAEEKAEAKKQEPGKVTSLAKLMPNLVNVKPGYGTAALDFANEIDQAVYVAGGGNPLYPDSLPKTTVKDFLTFAMAHTGLTKEEIEAAADRMRMFLMNTSEGIEATGKEVDRMTAPSWNITLDEVRAARKPKPVKAKAKEEQPAKVTPLEKEEEDDDERYFDEEEDEEGFAKKKEKPPRKPEMEAAVLKAIGSGRLSQDLSDMKEFSGKNRNDYYNAIEALADDGVIELDVFTKGGPTWTPVKQAGQQESKQEPKQAPVRDPKVEAGILGLLGTKGIPAFDLRRSMKWNENPEASQNALDALVEAGVIKYNKKTKTYFPAEKPRPKGPKARPKASILQDEEPGRPTSPEERDYDDIQRDIDAEEDRLVAGGMSEDQLSRLYNPENRKQEDFPPGWQPMPDKLAALYRERDAALEAEERKGPTDEQKRLEDAVLKAVGTGILDDRLDEHEEYIKDPDAFYEAVSRLIGTGRLDTRVKGDHLYFSPLEPGTARHEINKRELEAAVSKMERITRDTKILILNAGLQDARAAVKRATKGAGAPVDLGKVTSPEKKSAFEKAKDALAGFVGKKKTDVRQHGLIDPDTHPGGAAYAKSGNSWMIEHAKIRFPKGKNIGVVYANHDAMRIFMYIAKQKLGGANFGASDYDVILGDLKEHLGLDLSPEAIAVLDKLHADITEYQKQNPEGMDVVLADKKRKLLADTSGKNFDTVKSVAYEERLHAAQRKAPISEEGVKALIGTAPFDKARRHLINVRKYAWDMKENFDEIVAKVLAGQEMGLTLDEQVEVALAYRAALIKEHGEDVIVLFRYMKPGKVKEAFRGTTTTKESSGRTGVEPPGGRELQRGPTGSREGPAPGEGRERGVREGAEGAVGEGRGEGEGGLDLKASRSQPSKDIRDKSFVTDTARTMLGEWSAGRIKLRAIAEKVIEDYGAKARAKAHQVSEQVKTWIKRPQRHHNKEASTTQPSGPTAIRNPITGLVITGIHNAIHDPDAFGKAVGLVNKYVNFRDIQEATVNATVEKIIERMVDNLLWLHDKYVSMGFAARAKLWYDGGRKKVAANAKQFGITVHQAAAIMAAFSPQKDWFQNVDMTRRFHEWWKTKDTLEWTPQMEAIYEDKILPSKEEGDAGRIRKAERKYQEAREKYPEQVAQWRAEIAEARRNGVPVAQRPKQPKFPRRKEVKVTTKVQDRFAGIRGKAAREITDVEEMAVWFRLWDEAHNDRDYRILTPEGELGERMMVKNKDGSLRPAQVAWSGYDPMIKAIRIMQDGSFENISEQLGEMHKVRNFYNNLLDPNNPNGHITCDTHAVCAALLLPRGASAPEVQHNLGGGVSSVKTGEKGTYWIFAEAYRRAARRRGILPREMQSITWEATRGLFTGKKSEGYNNWADALWLDVGAGKITAKEARDKLYAHFKGISPPTWSAGQRAISDSGSDEEGGGAAHEAELSGRDVVRESGRGGDPGRERGDEPAGDVSTSELPREGRQGRGRIGKPSRLIDTEDGEPVGNASVPFGPVAKWSIRPEYQPVKTWDDLEKALQESVFRFGRKPGVRYKSGSIYNNRQASRVLAYAFNHKVLVGLSVPQNSVANFLITLDKWHADPSISQKTRDAIVRIQDQLREWQKTAQRNEGANFVEADKSSVIPFDRAINREERLHADQRRALLADQVIEDLMNTSGFQKMKKALMHFGGYQNIANKPRSLFDEITAKVLADHPFGGQREGWGPGITLNDRLDVAQAYRTALIDQYGKNVVLLFRYVQAGMVREVFMGPKRSDLSLAAGRLSNRLKEQFRPRSQTVPPPSTSQPQERQLQQSQAAPEGAAAAPATPRFEQTREVQKPARRQPVDKTRMHKFREFWTDLGHALTRQFMHLEGGAKYAELKQFLNRVSKAKGTTIHRAAQAIIDQLEKLDDTEYTHFLETVAYNDLAARVLADTKRGMKIEVEDLPWKIQSKRELFAFKKEAHDRAMANPKIVEALKRREAIWKTVKDEYIAAMAKMGYDVSKTVSREDYFRHRVLKHEEAKDLIGREGTGAGQRYKLPTGRSWLKVASVNPNEYSLDYIGSEFEVLHQMMYDTVRAEFLGWLKDKSGHNVAKDMRRQMAAHNKSVIMHHFASMARNHNRQHPGTKKLTGEDMYRRVMNTKQAIAISKLQKLASGLNVPAKFQTTVARLRSGNATIPELMPLAAWLIADGKDVAAAEAAGLLLKGVADKRRLTKLMAGKKYIGTVKKAFNRLNGPGGKPWTQTHNLYKADQRDHFFFATTITDEAAKAIEAAGTGTVLATEMKKQRVRGAEREQMVLPIEVIETLKEFMQPPSNKFMRGVDAIAHKPLSWWKTGKLIHPGSVIKYNLRNLSGDLEAVVTILPGALKHTGKASKEILQFMKTGHMPSPEFADWWSRGGMDANLQVAEIGEVNRLKKLSHLLLDPDTSLVGKGTDVAVDVWEKVWGSTRALTDYREGILRYATYIEFQKQIEASPDGRPKTFAKSLRTEVMALRDKKDRAYKLSNDLMLAYDEVTQAGQWTRRNLIPFWSFQEKNAQGYWRLVKNAMEDGRTAASIGYAALGGGALALRTGMWTAIKIGRTVTSALALKTLAELFNRFFWDDEEEDLPESVRKSTHLILGRDENGKVRVFSRLGLIDDVLEWGGLDASPYYVREYMNGNMTIEDMAWEMAKSPVNKVAQGLTPYVKTVAEVTSGKTWFPDVFNKREIRDRWEYAAREVGMVWLYHKLLSGKPQPALSMEKVMDFIVYRYDPDETQYNSFRYDKVPKYGLQNDLDLSGGSPGGMSMKHAAAALYDIRMGLRYDDQDAVAAGMLEYVDAGGTRQNLMKSIDRLHPLGALKKAERRDYEDQLSPKDAAQLQKAVAFWEEHFYSKIDELTDAATEAGLRLKKPRK